MIIENTIENASRKSRTIERKLRDVESLPESTVSVSTFDNAPIPFLQ